MRNSGIELKYDFIYVIANGFFRINKVWNSLEFPLWDLHMKVQLNIPLKYFKFNIFH